MSIIDTQTCSKIGLLFCFSGVVKLVNTHIVMVNAHVAFQFKNFSPFKLLTLNFKLPKLNFETNKWETHDDRSKIPS